MYICVYMHVLTFTDMHRHTYTHIQVHAHRHIGIYTYTHAHAKGYFVFEYTHSCIGFLCACISTKDVYIYIYKRICRYICTFTYINIWSGVWRFQPPNPPPAMVWSEGVRVGGQERTQGCEGCSAQASTLTPTLKLCRT